MTLKELLETYKEMRPAKRRLLLIMPAAAVFLFALMTAPHSPSSAQDAATLTASAVSNCAPTKIRVTIFGRSLMTYDWQSGNCPDTAKPRKVSQ